MIRVIKRNGSMVDFDKTKIESAILNAMKNGSGMMNEYIAKTIANEIFEKLRYTNENVTIYQIENDVYFKLIEYGQESTAKAYEGYRAVQEYKRINNTTDDSIMDLVSRVNTEVMEENSNKNATIAATQRDLIAGEVSKDIARRKLLPTHIVQAHDTGAIHVHDLDYMISPIFNCCLINIEDMLNNGTVINEKLVEPPKSFATACTIVTQIIAQVASNQYGGSSITVAHLAPFLRVSYEKYLNKYLRDFSYEVADKLAKDRTMEELVAGVQTIRYQLSTLQTTNGQFGCLH